MMVRLMLQLVAALLIQFVIFPVNVFAEKVKPLNLDCEVCPVVICYEGVEAKGILGKDGEYLLMIINLDEKKSVKIDLDGIKKPGSEEDGDDGYELQVLAYNHLITIKSIQDDSSIQIKTDFDNLNANGVSSTWTPEIHLRPSAYDYIEKEDDLNTAWDKIKKGLLYQYINKNSTDHDVWKDNLRKMILNVLEALIK